jgi:hypothetical protein
MSTTIVAPDATVKMIADFRAALLPASLAGTKENGAVLGVEMNRRGLPHTVENLVRVTNEILFDNKLEWEVEPAKLKARRANSATQNQVDAKRGQDAFAVKVKAGEAADTQKADDEDSIKQAKSLIGSYLPTKTTPRGQAIDYADQTESQAHWTKALNTAITTKVNLQEWVKGLNAVIQKRYADRERASERV